MLTVRGAIRRRKQEIDSGTGLRTRTFQYEMDMPDILGNGHFQEQTPLVASR